jgi:hypothetical protein
MTPAATILALIPLALSSGGGIIAATLATVVIGGLLSSMLLTLVVATPGPLQERIHTPCVGHSGILDEEKLVGLQFI